MSAIPQSDLMSFHRMNKDFSVMSDSPTLHRHSGADSFVDSALRFSAVRNAVESASVNAKHVMVVFDTCFPLAVQKEIRPQSDLSCALRRPTGNRSTSGVNPHGSLSHRELMAMEVPDQSIFRHFLIEGLNGSADLDGDGYVTGLELAMLCSSTGRTPVQGSQTPMFANVSARGNVTNGEMFFRSPLGRLSIMTMCLPFQPKDLSVLRSGGAS